MYAPLSLPLPLYPFVGRVTAPTDRAEELSALLIPLPKNLNSAHSPSGLALRPLRYLTTQFLSGTVNLGVCYGRTLSDASVLYFADVFYIFLMAALVGQTAERIFTKLSHVVDIRCYLRTY